MADAKRDGERPDGDATGEFFALNISENMGLRNILRQALVEAQGKDPDKVPMAVSWPPWLEDGILCLYARDFHLILRKTVHDTAEAMVKVMSGPEELRAEKTGALVGDLLAVLDGMRPTTFQYGSRQEPEPFDFPDLGQGDAADEERDAPLPRGVSPERAAEEYAHVADDAPVPAKSEAQVLADSLFKSAKAPKPSAQAKKASREWHNDDNFDAQVVAGQFFKRLKARRAGHGA